MMISTRGRYALRVMLDLVDHRGEGYIPLKDIAERQDISRKYLEGIMTALSKQGLLDGIHGKGGGYRLNREPKDYKLGEILQTAEGSLAPVACLDCGAEPCARAADCRTLPVWTELHNMINDYLNGVTLEDLLKKK